MKALSKLAALCSCILMSFTPKAQTVNWDTLPYTQQADFKLAQLNKAFITTNILYDRVMPIADIERFKAQENVNDTSSPRHLVQSYYELFNAAYNNNTWLTPDALDNRLDTNKAEINGIPIGLLFYKYNTLDSIAYVDALVDSLPNGQLTDKPNRPRSPYFDNTTFIASPLIADNELFIEGEDYTFYLDPAYFLKNENLTITQIRIDFGDGQGEWVVNDPFSTNIQARGFFSKILKKVGKVLIGRIVVIGIDIAGHNIQYGNPFKILAKKKKVEYPLTACKGGKGGGRKWVIEADPIALAQQNAIYGNPPISYRQKVNRTYIDVKDTAYFFFKDDGNNCTDAVVKRPVIFIDGFDPNNDRKVGDIYKNYINNPVTRNINGSLQNIPFGDYMLDNGNDISIQDDLDFIILDFKHGNDLLERNAMTLVALIVRMNATFGANYLQDITLIGPSMGSLIAQYALTYMENKGIPHRVKTYISFDGNHQGANVPIGLQNYVEYITKRGILKNIKTIREGLYNGYGARQQLAHHHSANSQFPAPDAMRTQFLNNLTALHPSQYPQNCRKVALINGTNKGILNPNHGTNTSILSIDITRKGFKSIWGLCNDDICKKIKWTARTATNSGTNRIAEMWTASPLYNTLFWLPLGKTNTYAQAAWSNSSQDNAPGGLFGELFTESYETHATFLAKELIYLITGDKPNFNINLNNFTMMPSYSSADLSFPTKNLYLKWDDQYLCGKTPFDYIYAPPTNEAHVFVSPQGSVYFENEARCAVPNLPVFVDNNINGSSYLCSPGTYSLVSCKPLSSSNIIWTATPSGIVTIAGGGNSISLTKVVNGIITLTASSAGTCGSAILLSKQIVVGTPTPTGINGPNHDLCYNGRNSEKAWFYVANPVSSLTYSWQIDGLVAGSGTSINVDAFRWEVGTHQIRVRSYSSACGYSSWFTSSFVVVSCSTSGFTVSPNPSSENISVSANNSGQNISKQVEVQEVELVDKMGSTRYKRKLGKGLTSTNISVSNLPSDIYTLRIFDGEVWHSYKVSIQH